MKNQKRSATALLSGFVAVVALSVGADTVMHVTGAFPPWGRPMGDGLVLLALAYRTLFGIAGSYITARLAPNKPTKHALAGGAVGLAASAVGAIATWNRGPEFGPNWYPLALIATAIPCAWAGARLYKT